MRRLETLTVAKPWGVDALPAPFAGPTDERIGEIWFHPPPEMPDLLVKYLFTSEKLSVQVHPSNAQAPRGLRGKEECWLVLDADPGASLAIGFRENLAAETVRAAALDGSIEALLEWHPVKKGDFFYLPAGTVHAIGAGVTILEVQQNSDITYRLFDYGRPRPLHLDEAIAVANLAPYSDARAGHFDLDRSAVLVDGPYFRVELVVGTIAPDTVARFAGGPMLALPLRGAATLPDGPLDPGTCDIVADLTRLATGEDTRLILVQST